jgi:GNAT superfamily N-acetyltransferase
MLYCDQSLSRRLETAEAHGNIGFVEARAALFPEVGATWIETAGTFAMFDGPSSPCTQTFCLGQSEPVTNSAMEHIEAFFHERGAPVLHEVSPIGDPSTLAILNERGYHPIELTSVLFRPLGQSDVLPHAKTELSIRVTSASEFDEWAKAAATGWAEGPVAEDFFTGFAKISAARLNGLSLHAEQNGRIVATASVVFHDGIALMAGASTVPEARRQGAQQSLVEYRLRLAVERGCDLAMMCAAPGSASQRNAERNGFRIAYTRIKWQGPNLK